MRKDKTGECGPNFYTVSDPQSHRLLEIALYGKLTEDSYGLEGKLSKERKGDGAMSEAKRRREQLQ